MAMTNEEITSEFETLFGTAEEEETPVENPTDEAEEQQEEPEEEEAPEDEESGEGDSEEKPEEQPKEDKQKAKQNYAFAQQRQQIKAQETFIKNLGKLIGMDGAKPEEIQNKVQEVLLQKQSQEQNVPVELLQRLQNAEEIIQQNQFLQRQNEVQSSMADLIEEHSLSEEETNEFVQHLINEGKNPLENPNVDLHAEYLKLHYNDLVQKAVSEALNKEKDRKTKVKDKGTEPVPGGGGDPSDKKIESVRDLDDVFGSMDL